MNEGCFVRLVKWLRDTRVSAKHSVEEYIDGIPKGVLAEVLKIVINSLYGKLGDENSEICDRLAVLKVTINGQLLIMMLCEELELNGIEVVSANTDGIVVKLYKKDKEKFDKIAEDWKEITKFGADSEEYRCYINRDIKVGVLTVLIAGTLSVYCEIYICQSAAKLNNYIINTNINYFEGSETIEQRGNLITRLSRVG